MIFVVMQNIFLNKVPIHETYDLKGSTVGRSTPMEQRLPGVALKDNDFGARSITISAALRNELMQQVHVDSLLLSSHNLNDFSFLLGVHHCRRPLLAVTASASNGKKNNEETISSQQKLPNSSSDISNTPEGNGLTQKNSKPTVIPKTTKHNIFQQDDGGVAGIQEPCVYFFGIIDILTDYGMKKIGEHWSKSVLYDSKQVSCIPPQEYQRRFMEYLESIIKGGEK